MKKVIGLLALSLILVSCESVQGIFNVEQTLQLNSQNGSQSVNPGTYNALLRFRKQSIRVEIENNEFIFNIPKNVKIPTNNGVFTLRASQVKQPYDLHGHISTSSTFSPTYNNIETCTYQRAVQVCGPQGCRIEIGTFQGWMNVIFYYKTDIRTTFVNLIPPQSRTRVASFDGVDTYRTKIYQYKGQCQ